MGEIIDCFNSLSSLAVDEWLYTSTKVRDAYAHPYIPHIQCRIDLQHTQNTDGERL